MLLFAGKRFWQNEFSRTDRGICRCDPTLRRVAATYSLFPLAVCSHSLLFEPPSLLSERLWGGYDLSPSVSQPVRNSVYGKRVNQGRHQWRLQAKGETYTHQTGNLCYNACLCSCRIAEESSISRLSWYFVKQFVVSSFCWSYAQLCMLTQDKSTTLWELHIL